MSPFLMVVVLGAVLVAPASDKIPPKAEFKIWVVEVRSEGRQEVHFDKGLEEIREAVKDSQHDTYRNLKTSSHTFKDAKPLRTALNDRYTLDSTVPTLADDGRYRLTLRVTMKSESADKAPGGASALIPTDTLVPKPKNPGRPKEIEAISSKLLLLPDEKVVVRGLKLEDGKEMVLVVSLSVPAGKP